MTEIDGKSGPGRRLKVLAIAPGAIVTVILMIIKPLKRLERMGAVELRVIYPWWCRERDLRWADVVVFSRATEPREYALLRRAKRLGKPTIYDTDDNLFVVPGDTPTARYHRDPLRQCVLAAFHREVDLVQVYNRELHQVASALNACVKLMPQSFDAELVRQEARAKRAKLAVVFPTSRGGSDTLSRTFRQAVESILSRKPDSFTLHVWGSVPEPLAGLSNIVVEPFEASYNAFIRKLHREGYAIGLAPLVDDQHHRCKTELKYREYGGCGIAGIYSDVSPYRDAVAQGETGLLVDNTVEAWTAALGRLVEDDELRARIAANAQADVLERYQVSTAAAAWLESFAAVLSLPRQITEAPAPLPEAIDHARSRGLKQRSGRLLFLLRPSLTSKVWRDLVWLHRSMRDG